MELIILQIYVKSCDFGKMYSDARPNKESKYDNYKKNGKQEVNVMLQN